jgi:GNAT superfamily N-acetyltransferase
MEMYQEYLLEKYETRKVIIEEGIGFIEYETYSDGSAFIWTLFIRPEYRGDGYGYGLEQKLIEKEKPKSITCTVDLKGKNIELSLRKILSVGYKLQTWGTDHIVLHKEIDYAREREKEQEK